MPSRVESTLTEDLPTWSDHDVGSFLIKLANTTAGDYAEVRRAWDKMSIQFAFGLLAANRDQKTEINNLLRELHHVQTD